MRSLLLAASLCLFAAAAFAQSDRGTITGTIVDPAGAVIANAPVEARNVQTGAVYQVASTATGNYTLGELPAGQYELSVTVPGFKKYQRQNIQVQVAQTLRLDVGLEVGSASESITVQAEVSLLKTESGEMSHNVSSERLDSLPVLGIGAAAAGSQGVRNPFAVSQLAPGTYYQPNSTVRVNGAPANSQSIRVEGQEASNGFLPYAQAETQPSVDAIQELSIQTSNYAAEFGQVGGGVYNFTMKSGTNSFHGTAYDYFVNEALNASQPFVNTKPVARRNDWGFTLGGPVWIPKIYNGHDRTFFFFNWEQFRETQNINTQFLTVPTNAFRTGDFSAILTGRNLCPAANPSCFPGGGPVMENQIYDPRSDHVVTVNGQSYLVRDPFNGNMIPASMFDPVAKAVQALIPAPTRGTLNNNAIFPYLSQRVSPIPALKIDHMLSTKQKLSFYWSRSWTESQYSPTLGQSEGLPVPITAARGTFIYSHVERLNYDNTLTPTLLLHLGVGYQHNDFNDTAPVTNYNAATALGLKGTTLNRNFPCFTEAAPPPGAPFSSVLPFGGMQNMGPCAGQAKNLFLRPSENASLTWVRSNHTYKFGAEFRTEGYPSIIYTNTYGNFTFNADQTSLPYLGSATLNGGTVGFPYASFLLGQVKQVIIAPVVDARVGKHQLGVFAEDSWKVTRKFTLDYGLRYDYSSYLQEQYGRLPTFSPTAIDTSTGLHGAPVFVKDFASIYPLAFAPRLGAAYQITDKTVLRAGFGVVYSGTSDGNGATGLTATQLAINAPQFGEPAMTLASGIPVTPVFPNTSPSAYPFLASNTNNLYYLDPNAGRPARQYMWSIGVQREIFPNMLVEASYVGNRGVWWQANELNDLNAITLPILAAHNFDLTKQADRTILTSPIGSVLNTPNAAAHNISLPYANFPLSGSVVQSLRPFPKYGSIGSRWAPMGKTWYDSLQAKVTKRYSHGLDFTYTFTWSKSLDLDAENQIAGPLSSQATVSDTFNRPLNKYISAYDQPFMNILALNYTTPSWHGNKALSWAVRDWQVGTVLQYGSGLPIKAPYAQNLLNSYLLRLLPLGQTNLTFANRVPGQPLFLKDLNCHCIDPNKDLVLNPAAWQDPAPGTFGTSAAYYSDYRYERRPVENFAFGRDFRLSREGRVHLNIRAEFTNIFNRIYMSNPTATNALQTPVIRNGVVASGFGFINPATTFQPPRQGTIVARFSF